MKKIILLVVILQLLYSQNGLGQRTIEVVEWNNRSVEVAKGEIMFKLDEILKGSELYQGLNDLLLDTDYDLVSYAETMGWVTIRLKDTCSKNWRKTMHFLQEDSKIISAHPNYRLYHGSQIIPNDPHFEQQWNLFNDGTVSKSAIAGADISALKAWDITTGNQSVVAAIFDTGIDLDNNGNIHHPDIANNHIIGKSTQSPIDVKDNNGHGTWVSGNMRLNMGGPQERGL